MKIAYLIAAHTDPTHLSRLINALHVEGATDFYVHLDKKVNMNDYRKKISIFTNKVTWVSDRIDARWGGGILSVDIRRA